MKTRRPVTGPPSNRVAAAHVFFERSWRREAYAPGTPVAYRGRRWGSDSVTRPDHIRANTERFNARLRAEEIERRRAREIGPVSAAVERFIITKCPNTCTRCCGLCSVAACANLDDMPMVPR